MQASRLFRLRFTARRFTVSIPHESEQQPQKKPIKLGLSAKQLRTLRDIAIFSCGTAVAVFALIYWFRNQLLMNLLPSDHRRVNYFRSTSTRYGTGLQAELNSPQYASERGRDWSVTKSQGRVGNGEEGNGQ